MFARKSQSLGKMQNMRDLIISRIKKIEQEKGIKILYACESGSRAWGFPSPDSDYDVRFIYKHKPEWYLTLSEQKDVIDVPINDVLDINGWDLRKALRLMAKSNAPILEWIQSPIVYMQEDGFIEDMTSLGRDCFSPIAVTFHYLSMSKKYQEACAAGERVKLKRYFYALRATMACVWIREKGTMAPIEFLKTLDLIKDTNVRQRILELIDLKATQDESYLHPREVFLDEFINETIKKNEKVANSLPAAKGDRGAMDAYFQKTILGTR